MEEKNANYFNLSIAEFLALEADLIKRGFTKIEQQSSLPIGQCFGKVRLFNDAPKMNTIVRVGKTSSGEDYKICIQSVKVSAMPLTGKTYVNVSANFEDTLKEELLNPQSWSKQLTLDTSKVIRKDGKELNVTAVTSLG